MSQLEHFYAANEELSTHTRISMNCPYNYSYCAVEMTQEASPLKTRTCSLGLSKNRSVRRTCGSKNYNSRVNSWAFMLDRNRRHESPSI